jgi:hypothetical protein
MIKIDQLRNMQEQRLLPALEAWQEAKRQLESAIALAESREREYRVLSEDVQRMLGALDLVAAMAADAGDQTLAATQLKADENQTVPMPAANAPQKIKAEAAAETSAETGKPAREFPALSLLRKSSRALFASGLKPMESGLSIR